MSKVWMLTVFFSVLGLVSCEDKLGGGSSVADTKLETEEQKTFYAMGQMLGRNLAQLDLSDKEIAALNKGVVHAAKGVESEVDMVKYQAQIQKLFQERMQADVEKQKKIGAKYMKEFTSKDGVKVTKSGLAYKILKEGSGKSPAETDTVEVHYHGTLPDGTVFDSSVDRGEKIKFALNRVIPGWTEGLQLMKEGGKAKFVIPSDLAYQDRGAKPKIPGGATLTFEVELLDIVDESAASSDNEKKGKDKS